MDFENVYMCDISSNIYFDTNSLPFEPLQERRLSRKFNGGLGDYAEMWEEFNVAMCTKIEGYIPHWEGRLFHS